MNLEKMYDIRVVEKYMKRGLVSQKDYDAFIAGLPDVAEEGLEMETKLKSNESEEEE